MDYLIIISFDLITNKISDYLFIAKNFKEYIFIFTMIKNYSINSLVGRIITSHCIYCNFNQICHFRFYIILLGLKLVYPCTFQFLNLNDEIICTRQIFCLQQYSLLNISLLGSSHSSSGRGLFSFWYSHNYGLLTLFK